MADKQDLRLMIPGPIRRLPADLGATIAFVVVTNVAVFAPVIRATPLRVVVGLPFVLFVPGYAFIAALFPEAGASPATVAHEEEPPAVTGDEGDTTPVAEANGGASGVVGDGRGIDGIERVALSFGLSIAIVPLLGLVLNFTPWGIRLAPIMVAVSAFTLLATGVAAVRRWELPADERFRVPYRAWLAAGRAELFEPETRADAALNVLLAASVVLALASVGYAVAVPKQGERFTEFYLLTETEDGDLVADGYPTEFVRGESRPVVVGIGNQEHEPVEYTVVVKLQRVRVANNSTTVLEERRLDTFEAAVEHNDTWRTTHAITPTMTGEELRLTYLLYKGEPTAQPAVDNAYRELHLWVNVSESG